MSMTTRCLWGVAVLACVSPALEAAIAESHEALRKILNGDPSGYAALFAERDDITLGNPFGPSGKGPRSVGSALGAVSTLIEPRRSEGRAALLRGVPLASPGMTITIQDFVTFAKQRV